MGADPDNAKKSGLRKKLLFILTNIISVACLWWVIHDQKWSDFASDVSVMHWGWVALAIVADVTVYVIQGWRWSVLLRPVEDIPVSRSARAVFVGLFANEILPFRTGELIRCYLQAEWSSVPLSVTISSALVERVFDGLWLVLAAAITVRLIPGVPPAVMQGAYALAVLVLIMAVVLAAAMFHKHRMHSMLTGKGWQKHFLVLVEDLYLIGHSRYLYISALISILYLGLQVVPFYAMMKAFGFVDFTWGMMAMVTIVMRFSSVVPQAPGNVGTFQALLYELLVRLHYGDAYARRFAFWMWAAVTLPLLVAGSIALIITGTRITELHRHAKRGVPAPKAKAEHSRG
jgi:uncharacterized protein (TIRG00374 family)